MSIKIKQKIKKLESKVDKLLDRFLVLYNKPDMTLDDYEIDVCVRDIENSITALRKTSKNFNVPLDIFRTSPI